MVPRPTESPVISVEARKCSNRPCLSNIRLVVYQPESELGSWTPLVFGMMLLSEVLGEIVAGGTLSRLWVEGIVSFSCGSCIGNEVVVVILNSPVAPPVPLDKVGLTTPAQNNA